MKRAYLSDCHAGQGEASPELQQHLGRSIKRGADYLKDCGARIEILMGDTVHHLGNSLQGQTSKDIALEQLAPLRGLLQAQREPASAIAGNTDWLLSDTDDPEAMRKLWLEYTGFPADKVVFPDGGLWDERTMEHAGARLLTPHGHAFDRAQRGDAHRPRPSDYPRLLRELRAPSTEFVARISGVTGAHARTTALMAKIGKYVKPLPGMLRHIASDAVGHVMKTREFEPEFARLMMMSGVRRETRDRCYGLMGHSHIAGIRRYYGQVIVNTGSFAGRNIPTQRPTEQAAHVVVTDDDSDVLELVQTFDPRRPRQKPTVVGTLDLRTGRIG
jgi:hypothetical protein